jgi:SAM-dependent methyltransferase
MAEADRRRWDARYVAHEPGLRQPSGSLVALADLLPQGGRALEVAGGTGRHALWLARRGLDVTLADISGVALELVRREAARAGLPLRTLAIDLEAEPLLPSRWDLILCVDFLWRSLLEAIPAAPAPGRTAGRCPSDPLEPPAPRAARTATPAGGRRAARADPGPGGPAIRGGLDRAGPA